MDDNNHSQSELLQIDMDVDYALEMVGNSMGTTDLDSQSRYLLNSYAYMVSAQNKITNYLRSKNMAAPGLRLVDTHIRAPEVIDAVFTEIKDPGEKNGHWVQHFDDCNYQMFATECNCSILQIKHAEHRNNILKSIEQDDTIIGTVQENY